MSSSSFTQKLSEIYGSKMMTGDKVFFRRLQVHLDVSKYEFSRYFHYLYPELLDDLF